MPSPSITHSLSDVTAISKLSDTPRSSSNSCSRSHSQSYIPPSINSSSCSSDSHQKTTNWSKKVGNYITRKSNSSSKNLDLTEESLEEFNRINEILFDKRSTSNNLGYSPYYQGLTDSSLVLNRHRMSSATSPERESNSTSISSGSKSSFIVKIQEWRSSLSSADKEKKVKEARSARPTGTRRSHHARTSSSSSSLRNKGTMTTLAKELGLDAKIMSVGLKGKKPLRERDSEPPPSYPPTAEQFSSHQSVPSPPSSPAVPAQTAQQRFQQFAPTSEQPSPSPPPPIPPQTMSPPPPPPQEQAQASSPERVYVWADNHRPETLKDFICNRDKALELQALAKEEDCGHFIFEGPPGVGKRTMIWALLRESYGADKVQAREESKQFILKGEAVASIKVVVKISLKHVEVNLSEVKGYEKHVIVELIQETINKIAQKAKRCNKENCGVIILYEADKLSTDALLYIKWQLGRHKGCCKVFFCCSDASKLQPIMSLCTVVKLLPPSNEEIIEVLEFIAKQEGIELPHQLAEKIANNSKNNLRQAIRSFQATWRANSDLKEDQEIMTGWEDDITIIAKNIVEEQSPKQLYVIRGKLQNLIEHSVCPEFIFEALVRELKKCSAKEFQPQIDTLYDEYKKTARKRNEVTIERQNDPVKKNLHHFMRIEEFTAKFMSCYKMSIMNKKGT